MFDFGAKWTPATPFADDAIEANGLEFRFFTGMYLYFVSGDVSAGLSALGFSPILLGATDVPEAPNYALAIARDRCLVVSKTPLVLREGWSGAGYCMTDMTDGLVAVELAGPASSVILGQATTLDWTLSSRSAAIHFAGVTAFASRIASGAVRLFIETSLTPYVRRWLEAASTARGSR